MSDTLSKQRFSFTFDVYDSLAFIYSFCFCSAKHMTSRIFDLDSNGDRAARQSRLEDRAQAHRRKMFV